MSEVTISALGHEKVMEGFHCGWYIVYENFIPGHMANDLPLSSDSDRTPRVLRIVYPLSEKLFPKKPLWNTAIMSWKEHCYVVYGYRHVLEGQISQWSYVQLLRYTVCIQKSNRSATVAELGGAYIRSLPMKYKNLDASA